MASTPIEEKRGRLYHVGPQRPPIIQYYMVPALEAERTPVVGQSVSGTLAFVQSREMLESVDRIALRGDSPSDPTDLSLTRVNANLLAPITYHSNSNSPTRKGGPESSGTRNGCADSMPIDSRDNVECSTPVDIHVEYSTPFSNDTSNLFDSSRKKIK